LPLLVIDLVKGQSNFSWQRERKMDKIKTLLQRPLIAGLVGLVVGLIIGLPILGWGVWPVKWKDADASFLREDLKKQYLCMVVDSYKVSQNVEVARARIDSLGLDVASSPYMFDTLQSAGCSYSSGSPEVVALKSALLSGTTGGDTAGGTVTTQVPLPTTTVAKPKNSKSSTLLLSLLCALFLIIGGALIYIFFLRKRKKTGDAGTEVVEGEEDYLVEEEQDLQGTDRTQGGESRVVPGSVTPASNSASPAAHFMTTYVIGDDLYDDSFSIDDQSGAFLGECGVGISDTIGVGDPKKVTAFEVWLFDKNDIQTVTKVLMSSHAMNDPMIRQRLASKGEPVLIEPGQQILLETATLQLEARVIELVYGQGALPTSSFFERLTLEIAVWPK
jgi:hypothetical protein